jgi:heptosyltransferase II
MKGPMKRPMKNSARKIDHLIIRAPNWVGDLVMATPIVEAALADPRFGRVTIAVRRHLTDVLLDGPAEPHLLPIEKREEEARQLREAGGDAILLLTNSAGAAWRAFRAGIPLRAGASLSGRGLLLTHRVVAPGRFGRRAAIPTAHLHRDVAGLLGISVPSLRPRLHFSEAVREGTRATLLAAGLGEEEPYVLCAPSAAFGAAKLWPPEHFAAALDLLYERHGRRGVITAGPGEEEQIEAVRRACRHPAVGLADAKRDLSSLKALVAGASLMVVGDSGPRWYAAAFEVPCVTVMGPNWPQLTASSLECCEVVRLEDLKCSPCARRVCPFEHPPEQHRCMRDLEPSLVVEAAGRLLAREEARC